MKLFKKMKSRKMILIGLAVMVMVVIGIVITIIFKMNVKSDKTQENLCIVQFNTNGGSEIETINVEYGKSVARPQDPKKEGFRFINWHLGGDIYNFENPVTENIILIAEWKAIEGIEIVHVYFNTEGGSLIPPIEVAKGYSISKPLNPIRDGYEFVEWQVNGERFDFNTIITEEITLTTKWNKKKEIDMLQSNTSSSGYNVNKDNNKTNTEETPSQSMTSSGVQSSISSDLKWEAISGKWYLTGTDDVYIFFTEDSSNYIYNGTRFNFMPSGVSYTGGQGGTLPKSIGYSAYSVALSANITNITSSSITIDKKYTFYRQKNYPSHIETELEKMFKNIQGKWYLDGYSTDVYVKFTEGTRYDEKVLFYDEHNFCAATGTAYPTSGYGTGYYSYYLLENESIGLPAYGWSYSNGYLYNNSGNLELKFSKNPTSTLVTGIDINKSNISLYVGETVTLSATISPSNATNKSYSWSTSNANVATIDSNGYITAKLAGTATITATTSDGNKTASCLITVSNISVSEVYLNEETLSIVRGDSTTLLATITPSNATNKGCSWSTSNANVLKVNNDGYITAKSAGTAIITVTTSDGNKTASCIVTVTNPPLSATGSIGYSIISSSQGMTGGISVSISAKGGTGIYTYNYINLYKSDGTLVKNVSDTKELFAVGYKNGSYYAEFEVRDSDGKVYSGKTGITTISM